MQASLTPNPSPHSSPLSPPPGVLLKYSRTQQRNLPHRERECTFPVELWVGGWVGEAGQRKQQLVRQGSYEGKGVGLQFEVSGFQLQGNKCTHLPIHLSVRLYIHPHAFDFSIHTTVHLFGFETFTPESPTLVRSAAQALPPWKITIGSYGLWGECRRAGEDCSDGVAIQTQACPPTAGRTPPTCTPKPVGGTLASCGGCPCPYKHHHCS